MLRYALTLVGGCDIAAGKIEFAQLGPGDDLLASEMRDFDSAAGAIEYVVDWREGATAVLVVNRFSTGAIPNLIVPRMTLGRLTVGENWIDPISPSSDVVVDNIYNETPGYRINVATIDAALVQSHGTGGGDAASTRTLELRVAGNCSGEIIVELPAGVAMATVDDVELYFDPSVPPGRESRSTEGNLDLHYGMLVRDTPEPKFERTQHEIRIRSLLPAAYRVFIRTASSGYWYSDPIFLKPGETRRFHPVMKPGATIVARVTGVADPDESITYQLYSDYLHKGFQGLARENHPRMGIDVMAGSVSRVAPADSEMRFSGLPAGVYDLNAKYSTSESASRQVPLAAAETAEVVFPFNQEIPVKFEIVDEPGAPVPTGELSATSATDPMVTHETTFENGKASLLLAPGEWTVLASLSPGERANSTDIKVVAPGISDQHRVLLPNSFVVRGKILDARGLPITNLGICSYSVAGQRPLQTRSVTNKKGEFELELSPGEYELALFERTQGHLLDFRAPLPPGEELIVRIDFGGLSGVVLDSETRAPIAGANVGLSRPPNSKGGVDPRDWEETLMGVATAVSGKAGTFTFEQIPAGSYMLSAISKGHPVTYIPCTIPSEEPVEVLLKSGGASLSGKIVDANGRPVPGFALEWLENEDGIAYRRFGYFESSAQGDYRLDWLPPGTFTALFRRLEETHYGGVYLDHKVEGLHLVSGETTEYNFTPEFGARMKVRVARADGMPVSFTPAKVIADGEDVSTIVGDHDGVAPRTNLNGAFTSRAIPAGAYRIEVTAPDGAHGSADVTLTDGETTSVEIRVE